MPKKRFGKELMVEISQELYDYFNEHEDEFKKIQEQINQKILKLIDEKYEALNTAADRFRKIIELRREIKKLKGIKGLDIAEYKTYSINIPLPLFFREKYAGLSREAIVLYSILLEYRLKAIRKNQVSKGNNLYLTWWDVETAWQIARKDFVSSDEVIDELIEYGLIFRDYDENNYPIYYLKTFDRDALEYHFKGFQDYLNNVPDGPPIYELLKDL